MNVTLASRRMLAVCCASLFAVAAAALGAPPRSHQSFVTAEPFALPPEGGVAGGVPGACGDTTLTQSVDDTTVLAANSVACASAGVTSLNGYARSFPIPAGPNFVVNCVDFGVEVNNGNDYVVTVNVYTGTIPGPVAGLTLLGSLPVPVPAGTAQTILTADFLAAGIPVSVPGGSSMVIEVLAPSRLVADGGDGSGGFFIGSNDFGQTAPSYIRAPGCGFPDFIDYSTIEPAGIDTHIVMRVDGGPAYWTAVTVCNDTGQPASDLHVTLAGGGGTLFVDPTLVVAPGCPLPVVPSNNAITDTVVIDWGVACVPPGGFVTFIVRSAIGPLTFVDAFWTDAGVNIGNTGCFEQRPLGFIGPPPGPFWAFKIRTRYTGKVVYGNWAKPPGQCWQRWCCWPEGRCCEYRIDLYFFPSRLARLFEVGVCFRVTGWRKWRFFPPNGLGGPWWLQVTTIDPPPNEPQDPPGGPPPRKPMLANLAVDALDTQELEIRQSDDGQAFSLGADLSSAFFDVHDVIRIEGNDPTLPPVFGFSNLMQAKAPGYLQAADALTPLIEELLAVEAAEPSPLVIAVRVDVEILQLSLFGIGKQMVTGSIVDPKPFLQGGAALSDLANQLLMLPFGAARFANAAELCQRMAAGLQQAGNQVPTGLPTPVEQDAFLAGLIPMFEGNTEHFAEAALPHVRIELDLGLTSWGPAEIGGVRAVQRTLAGEELSNQVHRLDEQGRVYLPIMGEDPVRVWLKPPTHLSVDLDVPPIDGMTIGTLPMVPGDANGDNCVDDVDLIQVLDEQGLGGEFADSVPSSDVNYDGLVNEFDIGVVEGSLGACGPLLDDCNENGVEDALDIASGTSPDENENGIPDECEECEGDTNGSGTVDVDDLINVILDWGTDGSEHGGDVNGSGTVDVDDLVLVILRWGPCEEP
jgi:hypothetical protein